MKKRKRLLVILSTFVMAAQPLCVAAEMQDAEGFGAVEEIWADEENEEEFSAAPEVGNEDLNGFQAEISTEENDRIEAEESGEIISGAIAGDSVDSGISLFSLDYYTDSYGAQLDGNAKALYDLLVQNYVVDYSQYLDSVDFPFEFPDTITFEAVVEDGSFQRKGESYVQATNDVKTAIQAASDAFSYDYPQAFWFRGSNYGYRVSCVRDGSSSTGYRGTFKNFTFKPANREISENAHTRMGDFMDGVQSAVAELNEQTLGMDMEQKIKRIHDYICQRVTYRNDNTLWVHSAASLFLDADPAFVCEGYAKSMKIFCYYMGINCACVSGTARGTSSGTPGAHMWNYVQMDDGNWYLVDATWDDVGTPPSSRYLLVGRATKGQYITIGEERVEYTSFSTTSAETAGPVFILPVLAEESYADNKGKNEPAVTVVPTVTPTAAVSAEPTPTVSAEPSADRKRETGANRKCGTDPDRKRETGANRKCGSDSDCKCGTDSDRKRETDANRKCRTDSDRKRRTDSDCKCGTDSDRKRETDANRKCGSDPDCKCGIDSDRKRETDADRKCGTDPNRERSTDTHCKRHSNPDCNPSADCDTRANYHHTYLTGKTNLQVRW